MNPTTDVRLHRIVGALLVLAGPLVGELLAQVTLQGSGLQGSGLNYSFGKGLRWLEPSLGNPLRGTELWPKPYAGEPRPHSLAAASSDTSPKPLPSSHQPKMSKPPWAEETSRTTAPQAGSPDRASPQDRNRSVTNFSTDTLRRHRAPRSVSDANSVRWRGYGGKPLPREESTIFLSPQYEPVIPKKSTTDEGESGVIPNLRRPLGW